ncbi:uncharacterized protein LTR77_009674 [Saxophila tyrrhenica]|uniref:Uncharacterized protein n=1 Tax=Saxophila tyrrhenica TaxID=1690608 RepID=A0AAV9P0U0_9PEZI|nr:hypothetical protein LTR77_009674 [Saxophila tyrrhenica]
MPQLLHLPSLSTLQPHSTPTARENVEDIFGGDFSSDQNTFDDDGNSVFDPDTMEHIPTEQTDVVPSTELTNQTDEKLENAEREKSAKLDAIIADMEEQLKKLKSLESEAGELAAFYGKTAEAGGMEGFDDLEQLMAMWKTVFVPPTDEKQE